MKKATQAVHAGGRRELNFGGINTPIFTSSAIEYLDDTEVRYPRYFNTLWWPKKSPRWKTPKPPW